MPTDFSPRFPCDFNAIDCWIFDLDNTLYPAHIDLFSQIIEKMNTYMRDLFGIDQAEAASLRQSYYHRYGTTLRGLMIEHKIDPDGFLEFVHDIDHSPIEPNLPLAEAMQALPGKRFIFTNGTRKHAHNVTERLGVTAMIDDVFDIQWADFEPKPGMAPYRRLIEETGIDPMRSAMFEDLARNLDAPKQLGMKTILVLPQENTVLADGQNGELPETPEYVDAATDDLAIFLKNWLSSC